MEVHSYYNYIQDQIHAYSYPVSYLNAGEKNAAIYEEKNCSDDTLRPGIMIYTYVELV